MAVYYNEYDKNAAAWLRSLIRLGLIADGVVDERSIIEVRAGELVGFTQCHFFAGIGGWSRALRLAEWSDSEPVWTASLPCQPFSVAGNQRGKNDERHLLPHFLELVQQCRPHTIFGEQVEGAIRHGWLDDLQTTMEAENYAVGHCILGAHSVGAPHIRQRLYWVAHAINAGLQRRLPRRQGTQWQVVNGYAGCDRSIDGLDVTESERRRGWKSLEKRGCAESGRSIEDSNVILNDGLANTEGAGDMRRPEELNGNTKRQVRANLHIGIGTSCVLDNWSNVEWVYCRDNKYRPILTGLKPVIRTIKPSVTPLVDGLPAGVVCSSGDSAPINANETQEARVMRLRGYGNAIVPQVAAEFIKAFLFVDNQE